MARPTKLTAQLQRQVVRELKTGVTVADTCAKVGIAQSTFYEWMKRGEADEEPFMEFAEAVSRALVDAKATAIKTLRSAMVPYTNKSRTVETFTEVRVKRNGETYEYKRVMERETVTTMAGDWRAAIEYLKRRYRDEWSEKSVVEYQDWRTEAIALIRQGEISQEAALEAFGSELAVELFREAGVSVQIGTGANAKRDEGTRSGS
jgi:hypothetical protein